MENQRPHYSSDSFVLWGGKVVDPNHTEESTMALREITEFIVQDDRVEHVLLPFADGVTLVRKKKEERYVEKVFWGSLFASWMMTRKMY